MFKITKKYEDFLGNDREESFRFNISEKEMLDLIKEDPVFSPDYLRYLQQNPEPIKMLDVIRKILVVSYGELSEDGKNFWKDDDRALKFVQSAAFDAILEDFISGDNPNLLKEFIIGTFPKKYEAAMRAEADKQLQINKPQPIPPGK